MLVCEAEGDLPLHVAWSASHRPLNPTHTQITERQTPNGVTAELHLDSLARRDAGPYRCSASNDFGQDEMIVYLAVKGDTFINMNFVLVKFHFTCHKANGVWSFGSQWQSQTTE